MPPYHTTDLTLTQFAYPQRTSKFVQTFEHDRMTQPVKIHIGVTKQQQQQQQQQQQR